MDDKDKSEIIFDPTVKLKDEILKDGEYIFATPGMYTHVDMRDDSSMLPWPYEDIYSHFIKVKGGTRIGWVAFTEALWNKNLLYFSFPKKAKRKLRKYARIRKRMFPRKKYVMNTAVFIPGFITDELRSELTKFADCPDFFKNRLVLGEPWKKEEER